MKLIKKTITLKKYLQVIVFNLITLPVELYQQFFLYCRNYLFNDIDIIKLFPGKQFHFNLF